MRNTLLLCTCLFICSSLLHGQQIETPFRYEFPDSIPGKWRFSPEEVYHSTIHNLRKDTDFKLSNKEEIFDEYARLIVKEKHSLMYGGNIYIGWDDMQSYLEEVVRKVAPQELKTDSGFKVYIVRDHSFNAFTQYDNSIFIHIGLLAKVQDEAALASIIAHEMGHYVHYDNFNQFLNFRSAIKVANITAIGGYIAKKNALAASRELEEKADEYATERLINAGYSLKSAHDGHLLAAHILNVLEKRFHIKSLPTHPASEERAKALAGNAHYSDSELKEYVVSESRFRALRKKANQELIHLLLSDGAYYDCVMESFENYLADPENDFAVFGIMEGLRRWQIFDPKAMNKKFFTWNFSKPSTANILEHLEDGYLYMEPSLIAKDKDPSLFSSSIAFKTNSEAFEYFKNRAEVLGCTECLLTMALYPGDQAKKQHLATYLASPRALHMEYAKHIERGNMTAKTGIGVLYDVSANRIKGPELEKEKIKTESPRLGFERFLEGYVVDRLKSYTEEVNMVNYNNINTRFADIQWMNATNLLGKDPYIRLDLLDPYFWDFCYRHGWSEIHTIDMFITDANKNVAEEEERFLSNKGAKFAFHSSVFSHQMAGKVPSEGSIVNRLKKSNSPYGNYTCDHVDSFLFPFLK